MSNLLLGLTLVLLCLGLCLAVGGIFAVAAQPIGAGLVLITGAAVMAALYLGSRLKAPKIDAARHDAPPWPK